MSCHTEKVIAANVIICHKFTVHENNNNSNNDGFGNQQKRQNRNDEEKNASTARHWDFLFSWC